MDSMSATVYTDAAIRSSDCTIFAPARWETSGCTAGILGPVTLPDRLRWVLANRPRPDGREWKPTPLSVAAGLGRNHLAQILDGRVANPDLATMEAVARVVGVSPAWLALGVGTPDDPAPAADQRPVGPPRFGELASWRDLLSGAKVRRPTMPAWVWDRVARSFPLEGASPTVAAVIHAADGILEQTPPPPSESRPRA